MNLVLNVAGRMDDIGKPAWIVAMVLGFVIWWPIGLGLLAFLLWSGRMSCGNGRYGTEMRDRWARFRRFGCSHRGSSQNYGGGPGYSGNAAFEDYKAETLRRLEDEQKEFLDFLYRLRSAKDKAEFDQFMAERRSSRPAPEPHDEGSAQHQ